MATFAVTINGAIVEVPVHEIPGLVKKLVKYLAVQPQPRTTPMPGPVTYMTYDECRRILSARYKDKQLRYHAGRLWGGICRLTKRRAIAFETLCLACSGKLNEVSVINGRQCSHESQTTGYRGVRISKESIIAHQALFVNRDHRQIGPAIKADYQFMVDTLSRSM